MTAFILNTLALIPFYLIGCFPSGFLIARAQGVKLSEVGSGNVGATNVARTMGKKAGALTLLGDILKGGIAVFLACLVTDDLNFIATAAVIAVCGHCFSIPGKLKGGKGVATALGVFAALYWPAAIIGILIFIGVFMSVKIVSAASITAALAVPIAAILLNVSQTIFYALSLIALLVVYRHRENLERLIKGTEKKFSFKKNS